MLNHEKLRAKAIEFVSNWKTASREKSEAQTFWNEFFDIFGISRRRIAAFEEPVKMLGDRRGSIDLLWKGTLLVEHKSKGKSLEKAYSQALDYFPGLTEQELPQFVLVSDFALFRLYDLDANTNVEFELADLPEKLHLFGFITGTRYKAPEDEPTVNIRVAEKLGELHDALETSGYTGHELEVFLVRLVYCLFADDTGIFTKDHFHFELESRTSDDGADTGQWLSHLFQILNTPYEKRQKSLDHEMKQFPYVNGELFSEALPMPAFDKEMRTLLLECCAYDWAKVSTAIFGSLFQSVMNKEERRIHGGHYTSEANILKVINALFLDSLEEDFLACNGNSQKLEALHTKLAGFRFLDPACGSGNFLILAYRELRKFELKLLKALHRPDKLGNYQIPIEVRLLSRIDVDVMHGIEISEFPAKIAEVALWLTDHQMNMLLSQEFGQLCLRLPLEKTPNIRVGNALRLDWNVVLKARGRKGLSVFVLGNPPYAGKKRRNAEQKTDHDLACKIIGKKHGELDYVCGWYAKAADYIASTDIVAAFVSTNSITQGEQAGILWSYLFRKGIIIDFAHRTFKWTNEARRNAGVYCIIIGFSYLNNSSKRLYSYDRPDGNPSKKSVRRINHYLVEGEAPLLFPIKKPICKVPPMDFGNMPNDDGNLIVSSSEEKALIESADPIAKKYIKPLLGSNEYIKGKSRWCLWLLDATPSELRKSKVISERVSLVRKHRESSSRGATNDLANTPHLFGEIRQPNKKFLLVPAHSGETRQYIPMSFFAPSHILTNSCLSIDGATSYHAGVLMSAMHMAWVNQVCGRLESRYRYSSEIVYNHFPWPNDPSEEHILEVANKADMVFSVRKQFARETIADMYDSDSMPKALLDAHKALDRAVDRCYGKQSFRTSEDRLKFLFGLHEKYTSPLAPSKKALKQTSEKGKPKKSIM